MKPKKPVKTVAEKIANIQSKPKTINLTLDQLIGMWKDKLAIINAKADEARKEVENAMMKTVVDLHKTVELQSKELAAKKK